MPPVYPPVTLSSRRQVQAAGSLVGLITLGLVGYLVGFTEIAATLRTLTPGQVGLLLGLGLLPLCVWGLALWLALATLDSPTTRGQAVLLFCVSLFFNSVTPFGQTGGTPLSGAVIAHAVQTPYERALAAIGSLGALNTLATLCLWLPAGVYLAAEGGLAGAREATAAAGLGLVGAGAAVLAGWRSRDWLADRLSGALTSLLAAVGRVFPGWSPPEPAAVAARVDGFVAAVERLATSRRRLTALAALAVAGQLGVVLVLYVALAFLWEPSLPVVLFVVPVSRAAAAVPTPGGIGSTEALLTGLLVTVAGATPAVAGAVAVLYRLTAFWVPALLGGVAAAGLLLDSRR